MIFRTHTADFVQQSKGFFTHNFLAELMKTHLVGPSLRIQERVRWAEIKWRFVAWRRIVQVEEKHKIMILIKMLDPFLGSCNFWPMRLIAPISIVIMRNLIFAAGTKYYVIHVHNRYYKDTRLITECCAFFGG